MSQRTDWLPASRTGQNNMALNWVNILASKAKTWGVPVDTVAELGSQLPYNFFTRRSKIRV